MTVLRAAVVTPLTGSLGGYGQATAAALALWARSAELAAPWHAVTLDVRDTLDDPADAMRRAVATEPDLIFGPYGSSSAVAAIAATDRPVWNHGGATSQLRLPAFPNALNVLAPASTYFRGALEAVRAADPAARRVSLLHSATGFGRDVGQGATEAAIDLGFDVRESVFEPGQAAEAAGVLPDGDVVMVAGGFEAELAAASILVHRPWKAMTFVGAGVDVVLASLGDRREGLLGPAQWLPQAAPTPDEGPDAAWFVDAFRRETGADPDYPAAQAFAAGVVAARCLRDAGTTDDAAYVATARRLTCRTLYGNFRLDPETGLQVGHRAVTVQWQGGSRRVVWPPEQADRPIVYPRPGRGSA